MRWEKLGRIYSPQSRHPKLASHAANPMAMELDGDLYRIFYSGRDALNRSSIGFVDLNVRTRKILDHSGRPVFEYGSEDSFYSHGVSVGDWYEVEGKRYVLFMGWKVPTGQHWRGEIGRLRVHEDFSMELEKDEPYIGRDESDSVSLSYPAVLQRDGGYRMWYGSTVTWDVGNKEMLHVIKHASSLNGEDWIRLGTAVPYQIGVAQAFSRPSVIADTTGIHMWFSYRSGVPNETYRIGYAYSNTGAAWEAHFGDVGIDISESGWDCDMIEYPYVFDHKGQRFMLYNGNGYGRSGIGLAVLEQD